MANAPTPMMRVCGSLLETVAARGGDAIGEGRHEVYDAETRHLQCDLGKFIWPIFDRYLAEIWQRFG